MPVIFFVWKWTYRMSCWLSVGLLMLLIGCTPGRHAPSPSRDSTLVHILADMHLAGARAEVRGDVPPAFRDSVLRHYGWDSTRFAERLKAYGRHPDSAAVLYRKVLDVLQEEHARLDTLR